MANTPSRSATGPGTINWSLVFDLRCKSKRGQGLSEVEQKTLYEAWKADPDRYNGLDKDVFEATKPFGAL